VAPVLRDPLCLEATGCWDSLGAAWLGVCDAWLCWVDAGAGLTSSVFGVGTGGLIRDWCCATSNFAVSAFGVGNAQEA